MAILELTKRRLNQGVTATDTILLTALSEIRTALRIEYVYYASIEDPAAFFILGIWKSMSSYTSFSTSKNSATILAPLDALSVAVWTEHMEMGIQTMADLPVAAPIMTISRAFLKPAPNPQDYYDKIVSLKAPIEEETKPWPCVFSWTIETDIAKEPGEHKWIMFVGWRTKKQHRLYSQSLRETLPMFSTIPSHYDEGTEHFHCWDVEKERGEGWAEVNMIA